MLILFAMDASDVAQMQCDVVHAGLLFCERCLEVLSEQGNIGVCIIILQRTLKVVVLALAQSESELLKIVPSASSM